MRILVTGAGGYLGSVLVRYLLAEGHEVTALDNFMYQQTSLLDCCHEKKITLIRGNACDSRLIKAQLKQADVIFPLACFTGAPLCAKDPAGAKAVSLDAVRMLLRAKSREQRVIFPNTNSGYGIGQTGISCDEKSPLRPVSFYGKLKVHAEKAVLDAGNCVVFRLATVFGASPRMRLDLLVNDFVYRAVTDGFIVLFEAHFKRNFIHVRDVARAFLHALNHFPKMKNQVFNMGLSDCNISKLELCQAIQKIVPSFHVAVSEIGKDPDKRNYIVSNAKIEAAGFRPAFSLNDGIVELLKAYQVIRRTQYSNL